jgi:uncharacterized SAM-binding protein YcdF (DUF218 family)
MATGPTNRTAAQPRPMTEANRELPPAPARAGGTLAAVARAGVALAAVLVALTAVFADGLARWLILRDPPAAADAALVLAGDPDYERTKTAVRLFSSGQVRWLILTGGEPGPGDSALSLRQVALALGVPAERIRSEQLSHSTHQAMLAVRPILEREAIRSVIVVTSPFHERRATWAARRTLANVRVTSHPAEPSAWRPEGWWKTRRGRAIVLGEYAKLVYYGLRGWI